MTLLLTLAGMSASAAVLAGGSLWRRLARRDHRCRVVTLTRGCDACAAVLEGAGHGGHAVCSCGAASPHLFGTDLLAWRAGHLGEHWAPDAPRAGALDAEEPGGDGLAALEAEAEADRRAVVRARRRPDPLTPQVLREARESGAPLEGSAPSATERRA